MKFLRFILLFVVFIGILAYLAITDSTEVIKRDELLNNNVKFSGYVVDFKQSNNHAFGIIQLQLTNSSVKDFHEILTNGIYPYKINGNMAELYITIPDGLQNSDIFTVDSKSHEYTCQLKKSNIKFTSNIQIIESSTNIDFVEKNTIFR